MSVPLRPCRPRSEESTDVQIKKVKFDDTDAITGTNHIPTKQFHKNDFNTSQSKQDILTHSTIIPILPPIKTQNSLDNTQSMWSKVSNSSTTTKNSNFQVVEPVVLTPVPQFSDNETKTTKKCLGQVSVKSEQPIVPICNTNTDFQKLLTTLAEQSHDVITLEKHLRIAILTLKCTRKYQ